MEALCLVEVAAAMHQATKVLDVRPLAHRVIQFQPVSQQLPAVGPVRTHQEVLQSISGARGHIVEQQDPLARRPRSAHHHVVRGSGGLVAVQHLQVRLIHLHVRGGQQLLVQQSHEGADGIPAACSIDPGTGGARA